MFVCLGDHSFQFLKLSLALRKKLNAFSLNVWEFGENDRMDPSSALYAFSENGEGLKGISPFSGMQW